VSDVIRNLAEAADGESPRIERARACVEIVHRARAYRWVGVYDAGDEERSLIAEAGCAARDEAAHTQTAAVRQGLAVVPVLGAESAIVIGTLDVESDRAGGGLSEEEVSFLEECAAVLRPLFE